MTNLATIAGLVLMALNFFAFLFYAACAAVRWQRLSFLLASLVSVTTTVWAGLMVDSAGSMLIVGLFFLVGGSIFASQSDIGEVSAQQKNDEEEE